MWCTHVDCRHQCSYLRTIAKILVVVHKQGYKALVVFFYIFFTIFNWCYIIQYHITLVVFLVLLTTMSVKLFSRKNDIHLESGSWDASSPPGRWGVKEHLPWLWEVPVAFPSSGYASWTSKQNMKHGQHIYILHPDHLQSAGSFLVACNLSGCGTLTVLHHKLKCNQLTLRVYLNSFSNLHSTQHSVH